MSHQMRNYLEYQADRVEAVLTTYRAPGQVTGGTVEPRLVRFFLNPAPHTRFAAIKRLANDMALALRVSNLHIKRGRDGIVLEFANPNPANVTLLALLPGVVPLPDATGWLGLADDGAPLLARLTAPAVAHILIAGTTGAGKSALLRSIAASLVLAHPANAVTLMCIAPKRRAFRPIAGAPHLSRRPVDSVPEACEALHSLIRVMERRDARGESPGQAIPPIVVLIDKLADLLMQGERQMAEALTRLLQRGQEAGIHLVVATQRPSSAVLSGIMRANFPLRLVGRVVSADDARIAAGRGGTNAHMLNGHGDFLAVSAGEDVLRFQGAYIAPDVLAQHLDRSFPSLTVSNDCGARQRSKMETEARIKRL